MTVTVQGRASTDLRAHVEMVSCFSILPRKPPVRLRVQNLSSATAQITALSEYELKFNFVNMHLLSSSYYFHYC